MNIQFLLLIGIALALGMTSCKADNGCPNEAVTPKTLTECPNSPVTPIPTAKDMTECPNLPITPSPIKLPIVSVTPATKFASYKPGCGNSSEVQTADADSIAVNQNRNYTVVNELPVNKSCLQLCCQYCSLMSTDTTTVSSTSAPTTDPPEALMKCPPGTIFFRKRCNLLYCPRGSQMISGRCVVIECPSGTAWDGYSCSVPKPVEQNLKFQTNILTQLNKKTPAVIFNYTNNIFVNASWNFSVVSENESMDLDETTVETTTLVNLKCCEVITPRICKKYNDRWHCYSRHYRRCGEFCIAPAIFIRPSRIHATPKYIVMTPIEYNCQLYKNCGKKNGAYDCSGCALNDMERCSYYCYRYVCPSRKCGFYDQEKYCADKVGSFGCQEKDGCFESWCF